jgi:hypothetical protein
MRTSYRTFRVKDLFEVNSGDFHAIADLDSGTVPLISCGDLGNGLVEYFSIPKEKQYDHAITVAYNGSWPLTTKYHPYEFGAKDDVAVLVPKEPIDQSVLIYVAALLNRLIWRYSYGRKCFKAKLQDVPLVLPVKKVGRQYKIDSRVPDKLFAKAFARVSSGAKDSVDGLRSAAASAPIPGAQC